MEKNGKEVYYYTMQKTDRAVIHSGLRYVVLLQLSSFWLIDMSIERTRESLKGERMGGLYQTPV